MTATKSPPSPPAQSSNATPASAAPVKRAPAARRRPAPAKPALPAASPKVVAAPPKADLEAELAQVHTQASEAAPVKSPAPQLVARIDDGKKAKTQKIVSDSYAIPQNEHAALKCLRAELKKSGRRTSKSEVLRAGLRLLLEQDAATLLARINALPPAAAKTKSKKD